MMIEIINGTVTAVRHQDWKRAEGTSDKTTDTVHVKGIRNERYCCSMLYLLIVNN